MIVRFNSSMLPNSEAYPSCSYCLFRVSTGLRCSSSMKIGKLQLLGINSDSDGSPIWLWLLFYHCPNFLVVIFYLLCSAWGPLVQKFDSSLNFVSCYILDCLLFIFLQIALTWKLVLPTAILWWLLPPSQNWNSFHLDHFMNCAVQLDTDNLSFSMWMLMIYHGSSTASL